MNSKNGNGNTERRHEKCLHHCLGAISAERPIQRPVPRQLKSVSRYWDIDCLKKAEEVAASAKLLSDDCLVQVRAQVMTRDDELVGWVPMGGGGWSQVGLHKRVVASGDDIKPEYVITGERVSDKTVVLNCRLKKDLQYTQATPTFHHWQTEDKKFGLTFQKNSDARAFDNAVKRALEDILEGSPEQHNEMESGDDEVFVQLDLPLGGRKDSSSQSASTTSTTTSSPTQQSPAIEPYIQSYHLSNHQHLHRITYVPKHPSKASPSSDKSQSSKSISSDTNTSKEEVWVKQYEKQSSIQSKSDKSGGGSDPDTTIEIKDCHKGDNKGYYVKFARNTNNDYYSYPQLDSVRTSTPRRDSLSSLKKIGAEISLQPPLPCKKKSRKGSRGSKDKKDKGYLLSQKRSRCVYCQKMFVHEDNMKGSCEDAPDKVHDCIEHISCICCARSMVYHCMADADGDFGHPCVCDSSDDSNCKKWTALTLLSFFVPCLWCYWPLTACHRCGSSCGCCGGRHKAA